VADTFSDIWRQVKAHCPLAPALLAQQWTKQAYLDLCRRRPWSWLLGQTQFIINDATSGTCNVTRGSATVSGGTLTYPASDVDRQFRVGTSSPVYTIISVNPGVSYTLDQVYANASATGTGAVVLDAYMICPADFQRFISVLDTVNNWQLHCWLSADELNAWDAQRSSTGTPWALAAARLKTQGTASLIGRAQYELWPYATAARSYPVYYAKSAVALADDDPFLGVLSSRGDIILAGALAYAAEWPGTVDQKNLYYNAGLSASKKSQFDDATNRLEVQDEEMYGTWLETISHMRNWPFAPLDSKFIQSHDFSYSGGW
jgi:hypothetical protein